MRNQIPSVLLSIFIFTAPVLAISTGPKTRLPGDLAPSIPLGLGFRPINIIRKVVCQNPPPSTPRLPQASRTLEEIAGTAGTLPHTTHGNAFDGSGPPPGSPVAEGEGNIPSFNIIESPSGWENDSNRRSPDRERQLLNAALARIYPRLDAHLKDLAARIYFVVNHSEPENTTRYLGWSSEDDRDYRFPDTKLFPHGTIKLNFSQKMIQALDFLDLLAMHAPFLRDGVNAFIASITAHELTHSWQYTTKPEPDLSQQPLEISVPNGLANAELLRGTKAKISYEHDAFAAGRRQLAGLEAAVYSLADAADRYVADNPEEFKPGGRFALLSSDANNPFVKRYLRQETDNASLGGQFTPDAHVYYKGQYRAPELTLQLVALNNKIDKPQLTAETRDDFLTELQTIEAQWAIYMNNGKATQNLVESYPYVRVVARRYATELSRCRSLLGLPEN